MYLNKERAAILEPEINPSRIELYSYAKNSFWLEFKLSNNSHKIENNISYSSSFPTVIHGCDLQYPLSFADFILLFSSTVFSLFLQSPFFVGLHIILQIASRWPC